MSQLADLAIEAPPLTRKRRRYKRYKTATASGLTDVPEHWQFRRLKTVCRFNYGEGLPADGRIEGCVLVYGSNGPVGSHNRTNTLGPCVVVGRKGSFGKVHYSDEPIFAIDTTYYVDRRCAACDLRWLYYALLFARLDSFSKDSAVPGLEREEAYSRLLPVPPLEEQRAIAAFLDRETAKIDELIAKKQRLTDLLSERISGLISHAVTRGLRTSPKLKKAPFPWLGSFPEHWRVVALSWVGRISNGSTPTQGNPEYWEQGEIPWVSSAEVNQVRISTPTATITRQALKDTSLRVVKKGAVLIGMVGQGRTRGMTSILDIDACINQNVAAIEPSSRLDPEFLQFALMHAYEPIRQYGRGGRQEALNCRLVGAIRIALPPLEEQREIVVQLRMQREKLSELAQRLDEHKRQLNDYRSALISAAVTGQIDVHHHREEAACP